MKGLKPLVICLLAIVFITGCSNKQTDSTDKNKIDIVTTFYPMYDFTKNIAGDKANITLLIPSTIEPHDWEPTPKNVGDIQKADLFVYNSTDMETWVPTIKESSSGSNVEFIEASKGITLLENHEEEEEHEHSHDVDPHVWLSPVLAIKEVENITAALVKVDPDNKAYYKKNSDAYIKKLQNLDQKFKVELKNKDTSEFITQHTAFSYLANEYNLVQVPIAGLSPDQEPSAAKLAELKAFAKEHKVNVIYFEELASAKVANTLAEELGAKTEVLNTLEGLSKKDQEAGKDYISIMEENLNQLKKSLFK
ncbi:metal ABC transporter substrate-binding protein [Niallia nealsonii]|uniref:Zinc ABC transporter substrate-binding protein n=1 Tax=Niallia nealsonii TaxID=115979 RepID=A0A2N0Z113_9BACI|nr:metal ABC transporter substrate-binding protein [Niallia nealsonii]PKG23206.1 zinc ABC transporter substrate-binding protein [Niallia nealsonii]